MRITVVLVALLVWLVSPVRAHADSPPASPARPDAQLSESDAIQIAKDEAGRLGIDLEHFDPPRATYISSVHGSKWHVFFIAKSDQTDNCFSVEVYRRTERPHLSWCS